MDFKISSDEGRLGERERQETPRFPSPPSPPLTPLHSSPFAIVPCTSLPLSALSQLPPTNDPVVTTTKEFCSSKEGDRIGLLAPLVEAGGILCLVKRLRHPGISG